MKEQSASSASWLDLRQGDALTVLRTLPERSVSCCVTSPPYWGLRNYGMEGQLGLEPTFTLYIERIVEVFNEVRRVLRDEGTLWLNLGDCYHSGDRGGYQPSRIKAEDSLQRTNLASDFTGAPNRLPQMGLKDKDLVGMPWRVAFALQLQGWWLRSDIIWSKPNPMPESVTDRPTKAHEYLFLFAKSQHYFYDADAIREPYSPETKALSFETMDFGRRDEYKAGHKIKMPDGWNTGPGAHGNYHPNGREKGKTVDKQRGHGRRHAGFNDRWDGMSKEEQQVNGANKRSVWEIATEAYPEAHFATFPTALVKPCILAGCPEGGVVLDPFLGSGTTALVANHLGRRVLGIELNPAYLALARKRCAQVTVWETA